MKTTIISGADATFFDLLFDLVRSIRACPESAEVDLCILDVGLTPEQRAQLAPSVTRIVPGEWDLDFQGKPDVPEWYKAMYCRPFFPRYFPEYELLIWVDADAWLCDWEAMRLFIKAAQFDGIVVVPEIDRTFAHCYHLRQGVLDNVRNSYLLGFGQQAADRFTYMPILNCGAFAMQRDAPYWQIWAETLAHALQYCVGPLIEQCALNVAVYTGRIPLYALPSWCNWNCAHSVPMLDVEKRRLLAPLLPNEPLSICHLTDIKRDPVKMLSSDAKLRELPLTYQAVRLDPLPAPIE
jgi:hypothetical protein